MIIDVTKSMKNFVIVLKDWENHMGAQCLEPEVGSKEYANCIIKTSDFGLRTSDQI
jgi:hypothetical protein